MINLSKRLKDLSELCTDCDVLLDIGCDHALIPISLLEKNLISLAVASDINRGPINAAMKNAREAGVFDRMRFIAADGLKGIDMAGPDFEEKKSLLLISGMGGPLIEKIMTEGKDKAVKIGSFVFSPHSKVSGFRRFLGKSGFSIRDEKLTFDDGKYYFLISCKNGPDMCKSELDYELGPFFFRDKYDEKRNYLLHRLAVFDGLVRNDAIKGEKRDLLEKKRILYEKAVDLYEMQ
ncbi:MAG: SAM-dependent methyltransferase [Lachnospiraceae bacterium]|nr:SAM-dependent methyltransferase [Lachnospiraceae bacterium]